MNQIPEIELLDRIKRGDQNAFSELFHRYYAPLCGFATLILNNDQSAEEIVQDFFVKFWEKKNELQMENSPKAYLFRAIKNRCLNEIKHEKIKLQHAELFISDAESNNYTDHYLEVNLKKDIEESIAALPEKRREIFRLSREEGLKYREIAKKLNISVKTVEAQMGLAIKTLREKLKKYNSILFFFACFYSKTE